MKLTTKMLRNLIREELSNINEKMYEEDMYEEGMYEEGMYEEGMYEEGMYEEDLDEEMDDELSDEEYEQDRKRIMKKQRNKMYGPTGHDKSRPLSPQNPFYLKEKKKK